MEMESLYRRLNIRGIRILKEEKHAENPAKSEVEFLENVRKESLVVYSYPKVISRAPLVIFSHGGTIDPDYIGNAVVPQAIFNQSKSIILCAPNHRVPPKEETNLDSRVSDLLVTTEFATRSFEQKWNGKIVLIGHSAGGHVAANAVKDINPDGVVLIQPAMYAARAEFANWGMRGTPNEFGSVIKENRAFETSTALNSLRDWGKRDKRILIVHHTEDAVVKDIPKEIYAKGLIGLYGNNLSFYEEPGRHGPISSEALTKIVEFISTFE